jgi:hypothetical protein
MAAEGKSGIPGRVLAAERGPNRSGDDQIRYEAFLSYSHHDNRGVAVALQQGMEGFAKPWYRLRAMRVFRDDASLSANPDLWGSIEEALSRSSWLIVIGSPHAARSPWVQREVQWWLEHRDVSTILLAVASGDVIATDSPEPLEDWADTAVPPVLAAALTTEPRWVDLRQIEVGPKVSAEQRERLRRAVADVVATIRGRPKEDMYGDALREHQRTIRLGRSAILGLVVLSVAAITASLLAVDQRNSAQAQARIATSRQLASTAQALTATDLNSGLLLAAEAYVMDRSPVTRSALLRTVTTAPTLLRYLPSGRKVSALATAANGSAVAAGTEDGYVVRWDTTRFERQEQRIGEWPITLLALSADGGTVLAGGAERAALWRVGSELSPIEIGGHAPSSVAVSPSGATLAVTWREEAAGAAILQVYDALGRPVSPAQPVGDAGEVALEDDQSVLWINSVGVWERRSARTLLVEQPAQFQVAPAGGFVYGRSADGAYYAFGKNDVVSLFRTRASPGAPADQPPEGRQAQGFPTGEAAELAVTPDGSTVAVANAGTVYVADTYPDAQAKDGLGQSQVTPIVGVGPLNDKGLAFAGNGLLVGAGPAGLTVWDLNLTDGLVRRTAWLADGPTASPEPQLSFAADGTRLAVIGGGDTFTQRADGSDVSVLDGPLDGAIPLFGPDGTTLYLAGAASPEPAEFSTDDPGLTLVPLFVDNDYRTSVLTAEISTDGSRVVVVDSTTAVHVFRTADRTIERSWGGGPPRYPRNGPWPQATGWASVSKDDLARVAMVIDEGVLMTDVQTGAQSVLPGGPATEVLFRGEHLLVRRPNGVLEFWDPLGTTLQHELVDRGYNRAIDIVEETGTLVRLREDGTVVLTDYRTGDDLGSFPLPKPVHASATSVWEATTLAVDQRNRQLITATSGGEMRRWRLDEQDWLSSACRMAGRDLTPDEWRRYVGTPPPDDLRCGASR